MNRSQSCCFTGHRSSRLPWGDDEQDPRCLALKARLKTELEKAYAGGFRHFFCGMAQGADLYFCEAVLALRAAHPDVTLEAAVPFQGQADRWPEADRLRRNRLLDQCNLETVVQHHYTSGCMTRRNRYMVDRSALLIVVYDNHPHGGTFTTLTYAMKQGLKVELIEI